MDLFQVALAGLIVLCLFLVARYVFRKMKVDMDNDILVVAALIVFILVLVGRIKLGI